MPIFTNTAAIWGSLIFIGLIAIYFYRRRSRNIVVSSIMFFSKSKSTAEGGQKLHKFQAPLILFIEILIFLFFIFALADPIALHRGQLLPITIVLDDSLSMKAGGEESAYNLSLKYLKKNILSQSKFRINIIKAGVRPKYIGRRDMTAQEAENSLRNWNCDSITSNLMDAVAQSIEISSDDSVIIVLTDHLNTKSTTDNIKWISFGKPRDNLAITSANRTSSGRTDRCFFEFTNFSNQEKEINAEIVDITKGNILESVNGKIGANSSRRIVVKLGDQKSVVKAVIKNDSISFDNEAVLLPVKKEKLKISIRLDDKFLADNVKKAVLATELAVLTNEKPQLVISDKKIEITDSVLTQLIIHNATESIFLAKSFATDKNHFITSDLPLEESVWVADSNFKTFGKVLLISSGIPLICLTENSNYLNTIYLNYCYGKSRMEQTTFWPVFFYNVIEWAYQYKVGPLANNYKSGSKIEVRAQKNANSVSIVNENDLSNKIEAMVNNGKVFFNAGSPGIYNIKDGELTYKISVNLCSYEESNLINAKNTEKLPELIIEKNMNYFKSVKWWFIMVAFALLLLHQWLISRRRSGYAF